MPKKVYIILKPNKACLQQFPSRNVIKKTVDDGLALKPQQNEKLKMLCDKYKVKRVDIEKLLRRIDIIPPSLALGQAIIESGWGHSYAALQKNSPFGMTISQKVKAYETLYDSIASYVRNLNSNHAYREMRKIREQLRHNGSDVDGHTLIGHMVAYSEERKRYIGKVRNAISLNGLKRYDSFCLEPSTQTKIQA